MYGKCKDCAKYASCHKPVGYRFGFCETDFEPKEKPSTDSEAAGMQWKKVSSSTWEAEGKFGKFRIERFRGKFWSRYASEDTAFNLRPKDTLNEAKSQCEDNDYWEVTA